MSEIQTFQLPVITDEDIAWAANILGLPTNAFAGEDGADPRQEVLKSMEPIDVAACPGSGKTTLLVAKLAILASKWQYRTRGICVLSHTNAARREIETRLGNTSIGRSLLTYPHYIGTIHGFVNEFLALPWLRTKGYPGKVIDDDVVERRRRSLIQNDNQFSALKYFVERNEQHQNLVGKWVVSSPEFAVLKTDGTPQFKNPGPSATQLCGVVEAVIRAGYQRYDEMFMWAADLVGNVPDIIQIIRGRFPLLFIDEAQDNSEAQSAILHRIFLQGGEAVVRQRFGDENQAIYESVDSDGGTTDKFPIASIKQDLPNSHRFGQNIANLADPLGLAPYGMVGQGPRQDTISSAEMDCRHTIFLFDENSEQKVLDEYSDMLLETFSDHELREGVFTAVGQIHRDKGDGHRPRHVGHYWPDYDPELSVSEPKPRTFVQYVFAGLGKAEATGETHLAVEKIAEGILRLAGMAGGRTITFCHGQSHRRILDLLEEYVEVREIYKDLMAKFVLDKNTLTREAWTGHWMGIVYSIAEVIAGEPLAGVSDVAAFLEWKDAPSTSAPLSGTPKDQSNICRRSKNGKEVAVRVGSVHSVKGETHTATLVLETFWYESNLDAIKAWLCGDEAGYRGQAARVQNRLRIHYVAMTRPSHLLCLAMKRASFENSQGDLDQDLRARMEQRGWQVVDLTDRSLASYPVHPEARRLTERCDCHGATLPEAGGETSKRGFSCHV